MADEDLQCRRAQPFSVSFPQCSSRNTSLFFPAFSMKSQQNLLSRKVFVRTARLATLVALESLFLASAKLDDNNQHIVPAGTHLSFRLMQAVQRRRGSVVVPDAIQKLFCIHAKHDEVFLQEHFVMFCTRFTGSHSSSSLHLKSIRHYAAK